MTLIDNKWCHKSLTTLSVESWLSDYTYISWDKMWNSTSCTLLRKVTPASRMHFTIIFYRSVCKVSMFVLHIKWVPKCPQVNTGGTCLPSSNHSKGFGSREKKKKRPSSPFAYTVPKLALHHVRCNSIRCFNFMFQVISFKDPLMRKKKHRHSRK